jgi:osmotically-inducible protein OsmY
LILPQLSAAFSICNSNHLNFPRKILRRSRTVAKVQRDENDRNQNNIAIKPSVLAKDVKEKIESALQRHAKIEAAAIEVSVRDGNKVLLEGKVDNWAEREAVENAAWSVTGVQSVGDRLIIAPYKSA